VTEMTELCINLHRANQMHLQHLMLTPLLITWQ